VVSVKQLKSDLAQERTQMKAEIKSEAEKQLERVKQDLSMTKEQIGK